MVIKCCVFVLFAVILQVCASTTTPGPVLKIPNGKIQGTVNTSPEVTFLQFKGIPYAKPPVGKLRFAPPKPMSNWSGIWMANSSYTCIQVDHYDEPQEGLTKGTEDCLYINVFTPGTEINAEANLDVIAHIHGGGFMFGSAHLYAHPKPFMSKNVIFVTMNYRLGIFGFMSLEDKYLPGNLGMKDQVMALEWIRDNIKYFGGNPASVTITGLSAGAASVHYHMVSPMSKGLFHNAISASGNVLDPWTIHEAPRQKAKMVGKAVGCGYEDSKKFLSCLKSRSAEQLVETTKLFREWIYLPFSPFGLVVDSSAAVPFLPEQPFKLLSDGMIADVPWMASLTTAEGLYPVAQLVARKDYFDILAENFEKYLPPMLHYSMSVPKSKMNEVTNKIIKEYLKDKQINKDAFSEIIQMASDRLFDVGMEQSVRLHSKAVKSSVYFYSYDYTSEKIWSLPQLLFGDTGKYGVSHADDILMMFETPMQASANDQIIIDYLVKMWVDFARTGKPSSEEWKPVSKKVGLEEDIDYMYIGGPGKIEMRKSVDFGRKIFWKSLPIIENEKLFTTKHNIKKEEL